MEKKQFILEKLLNAMFIVCLFLGGASTILLFKMHIKKWSMISNVYPEEPILFVGMVVIYLLALKFKKKYFRRLALLGVIFSGINLVGFRILSRLM